MRIERLGVIGGGAWGTALAQVCASSGRETLLWAREAEVVASVNGQHENSLFLPGIPLYTVATLSALVSAWLALGLYAGLALFYVLESSIFGRDGG